jgi:putative hydrolase of the HAD superfamily
MEIETFFDMVIASGEMGVAKPDPAIFQVALDKLLLGPEAVWHVGDSLANDVAGAKAAGLTSVWLNRSATKRSIEAPQPDFEITSLSALVGLIEETGSRAGVG